MLAERFSLFGRKSSGKDLVTCERLVTNENTPLAIWQTG